MNHSGILILLSMKFNYCEFILNTWLASSLPFEAKMLTFCLDCIHLLAPKVQTLTIPVWNVIHNKSNVPVKSKLQHHPGIWRLFLPGIGGEALDHHSYGLGNLIASLDFMLRVAFIQWVDKSWRRRRRQTFMNWKENIAYSWRIDWKAKAYTNFVPYLKVFRQGYTWIGVKFEVTLKGYC